MAGAESLLAEATKQKLADFFGIVPVKEPTVKFTAPKPNLPDTADSPEFTVQLHGPGGVEGYSGEDHRTDSGAPEGRVPEGATREDLADG